MAYIRATGTAVPPYRYKQQDIKSYAKSLFSQTVANTENLFTVFDNAKISTRYLSKPIEWYLDNQSITDRRETYTDISLKLCEQAINQCLDRAKGVNVTDIDCVILVSTTGMLTPTLDAHLLAHMGFSMHTKRVPLWGLGCAGGAAGLSRAMDFIKANPEDRVLVVAVETCSITFQMTDMSKTNAVATALFSDGAAAVLLEGKALSPTAVKLDGSFSTTWPQTIDVMGWNFNDQGMKVVFSRQIPQIVYEEMKNNLSLACEANDYKPSEIQHYLVHPGGRKVLEAYQKSLDLDPSRLQISWEILSQFGNMSSPTVLFVLDDFLTRRSYQEGDKGVISALGPGFSAEHVFFKCIGDA